MKKCYVCKQEKELVLFSFNKRNPDGYARECRECKNKIDREYRAKKREDNSSKEIDYSGTIVCCVCKEDKPKTEFNKNRNTATGLTYECKPCQGNKSNNYYKENKEEQSIKQKEYYLAVREEKLLYQKEYQKKHKDRLKEYGRLYNLNNRDKKNALGRVYETKRKAEDPIYKFKHRVRSMVYCSFKRSLTGNYRKSQRTEDILGCTMNDFIDYISSKFTEGMSLDNHGDWHIDHIIPLASANSEEEITKLCHHTNLQPLWGTDNMVKGKKMV